ncbi:aminotransferase class I/II-fold pyridoxal phosphate-dependent enzyme [Ideonella livida]|uniref:Aminotransferase class I/II-fold pyridoxal phosphate-dependent enzyme n=1 Tax=Ideonella livida TaxID=2707176 RepID=A0A7C9TJ48_9BURK|nr:aminotransferase class I/II-fold pyridoxal phosphate-dependent enzyme [Ideonella livida]NDY91498.1 aminotransferase class I/II-fold pyridoxal phosphate-dependent enzyme [Ideonella livida]
MTAPLTRILVVSADPAWRQQVAAGLTEAAHRLAPHPFVLHPLPSAPGDEALRHALSPQAGEDLQGVLIDHGAGGDAAAGEQAVATAQRLTQARPELSLYMVLEDDAAKLLVERLASDAVDGYFFRDEADLAGWCRILAAEVAEKSATPFYDALRRYVAQAKDSWHTPGHGGGDSFKASPWVGDFHDFVGEELLRADLSVSVPALDSLMHPTGVIAQAQRLAAQAFGARKTYFATNGTSTSNKVIFQTLLTPGDTLLLDRNCHKSVHHGVILSGARPVYLDSSVNRRFGLFGPVPLATLRAAIAAHPEAKVLILTSCTYDGLRYDLRPIVQMAHAAGIKVIVDEAWYGHARFHPGLRPTALECGADYVTQSTHKVLSAFSQASMIHVNDPDFDEHLFRENFNMHTSTSPQYNLIASLDVARRQAVMEGFRLLDRSLQLAAELREKINATGAFRVLELAELLPEAVQGDGIRLDPTKLTIDLSASGWGADELREELISRFNIQVEKNTHNTLTLLLTIGTTRAKASRLFDAMLRLAKERRTPLSYGRMPEAPRFSRLACLPRDAFYERGERLPVLDDSGQPNPALNGRVCCDQIVPYPPGIPVLVPGQVIEPAVVAYLARLLQTQRSIELHGLCEADGELRLRVLREAELARLPALQTDA